jgi:hypothetical protein
MRFFVGKGKGVRVRVRVFLMRVCNVRLRKILPNIYFLLLKIKDTCRSKLKIKVIRLTN